MNTKLGETIAAKKLTELYRENWAKGEGEERSDTMIDNCVTC